MGACWPQRPATAIEGVHLGARNEGADAPNNRLPRSFYEIPGQGSVMMTRTALRDSLLATGGQILARGHLWDVVATHLGAGVYRVTLRLHE